MLLLLLFLLPLTSSEERAHADTYFLHRYKPRVGLSSNQNQQLEKCILRLELIPTNCQIYMSELMLKFLPFVYQPETFNLQEVLNWSVERYPELMEMCNDNCYNNTIAYTYEHCTAQLPVSRFFPDMTASLFSDTLQDLASLLCYTTPTGDSCLKHEADLITGRAVLEETVLGRCFIRDTVTNETVLPGHCLPQCALFLKRKIDEYGCCLSSWSVMEKYSAHLSKVIYLYPDKMLQLLEYCGLEPPDRCPYVPDTTKISTGMISFLGVAGGIATIAIAVGVIKNLRDG